MAMKLRTVLALLSALAPVLALATSELREGRVERQTAGLGAAESHYGIIESIESSQAGIDGDGLGDTVIGGALGGIAAHQVGSACGEERTPALAKVVDAGIRTKAAVPEKRRGAYFIRVRLDDRSYQTVAQIGLDELRVGDSVEIGRGRLRRCEALSSQGELPANSAGR
jgi:outer membrane lipoprotein SlyB